MKLFRYVAGLVVVVLLGCESAPVKPESTEAPKPQLQFVDLQVFDRALGGALGAPLPRVDVAFYDRVTPSALPERLQKWMAAVEAGGGAIKVMPPPSTVTAKSPFLLISAISSMWSASRAAREYSHEAEVKAARDYDAEIILRQDDRGDTLVDKVVFLRRAK